MKDLIKIYNDLIKSRERVSSSDIVGTAMAGGITIALDMIYAELFGYVPVEHKLIEIAP